MELVNLRMKTITVVTLIMCLCGLSFEAVSQSQYAVTEYMKVKPGMWNTYLETEKAWAKVHAQDVADGNKAHWLLAERLTFGTSNEFDFMTVNFYETVEELQNHLVGGNFDEWMQTMIDRKIISDEEIALMQKTNTTREMVRTEVAIREMGTVMNEGDFFVINQMKSLPNKYESEHLTFEEEVWKPMHEARIADGNLSGWEVWTVIQPSGSEESYDCFTVDVYEDLSKLEVGIGTYVEKVHPGKSMADLTQRMVKCVEITDSSWYRQVLSTEPQM